VSICLHGNRTEIRAQLHYLHLDLPLSLAGGVNKSEDLFNSSDSSTVREPKVVCILNKAWPCLHLALPLSGRQGAFGGAAESWGSLSTQGAYSMA
jgi:hypothetical protein